MPNFISKRWHGYHAYIALFIMLVFTVIMGFYSIFLCIAAAILTVGLAVYLIMAERAFRKEFKEYVNTLSYRFKKSGTDIVHELPFGIVLYQNNYEIEWHNPFVAKLFEAEQLQGELVTQLIPALTQVKEKDQPIIAHHQHRTIKLIHREQERIIYIFDITEQYELEKKYDDERIALGILMIDNFEEVAQGLDDQQRSILLSKVTTQITEWSSKYELLLKRLNSDRFLLITDQNTLRVMEQSKFDILDDVREQTSDQRIPVTLSIGFAAGAENSIELGQWTQRSLDIALGRGGDQVSVKFGARQTFYGGKSNAVEKRTKVRARVIAHSLRDLIKESSNVLIMGHRVPDMDSIGAAVGVLKAARMFNKEAYIVIEGINPSINKMMEFIEEDEKLYQHFITPDQALSLLNQQTLSVVVDTHKQSMLAEPRLIQTDKLVVIDHHRRGEEFLSQATLVYLEPYASSTSELVAELLQYVHDRISLDLREATSLLAGITIDTKSFTLRTGARTFEAASFLRRNGADPLIIQHMMQEDLTEYLNKAEIIKHTSIMYNHIAVASFDKGQVKSQLIVAKAADTLLTMSDIYASFVIAERQDGIITISARSLGQINVQVIMEKLGGGGHLTNAAVQLEGTVAEVTQRLSDVLQQIEEEEGLFQ